MSEDYSGLPKFPTDRAVDMERLHEHLARHPEPTQTFSDWLRHTWPSLALVTFMVACGVGLCVIAGQFDVIYIGIPGPILLVVAVYVVWRSLRNFKLW